jgi:hypothetical protein
MYCSTGLTMRASSLLAHMEFIDVESKVSMNRPMLIAWQSPRGAIYCFKQKIWATEAT